MLTRFLLLCLLLILIPRHSPAQEAKVPERQRFVITHCMDYTYDRPVSLAPHVIRLIPQAWNLGTIVDQKLTVQFPGKHRVQRQVDLEGNVIVRITFEGDTKRVAFQNQITLEIPRSREAPELVPEPRVLAYPFSYLPEESKRLSHYLEVPADPGPRLAQLSHGLPREHVSSVTWLGDLAAKLQKDVKCFARDGVGVLPPEETLAQGGSCRDLAWVMIQVLRRKGVAARFVSGYQIPPWALAPGVKKTHPAELHAWVEAYLPGCGWVGLDPTTGKWIDATYIPLATAAEPHAAAPLQGTFAVSPPMPNVFARSTLKFSVTVEAVTGKP